MNTPKLTVWQHLISIASFTWITLNLLVWLPVLVLASLARILIPLNSVKMLTFSVIELVYRIAVVIDRVWIFDVLNIKVELEDEKQIIANLTPADTPLIITNHQSWFDVFLLQSLIAGHGPILKFLIKKELLWVPVLGWVCLTLNFPRLHRTGDEKARSRDLSAIQAASSKLGKEPGALLLFPEGTRFSQLKKNKSQSPYEHALRPRSGGLNMILNSISADTPTLVITIRYDQGDANCWKCMSGIVDNVYVKVESFSARDIQDEASWLNQRWMEMDDWLAQ